MKYYPVNLYSSLLSFNLQLTNRSPQWVQDERTSTMEIRVRFLIVSGIENWYLTNIRFCCGLMACSLFCFFSHRCWTKDDLLPVAKWTNETREGEKLAYFLSTTNHEDYGNWEGFMKKSLLSRVGIQVCSSLCQINLLMLPINVLFPFIDLFLGLNEIVNIGGYLWSQFIG